MNTSRIDIKNTAANISRLRIENNLSVKDIQEALGFNTPQAFYKWQRGETLPSIDNLVILADIYGVGINQIVAVCKADDR
ncbi:MAG: helix-turn-helix transcriptional regulator [Erysipelotrichaceae bacterium]|nr:helix-turn-helix transcriptional regulator [Erysipelotrichaceae bacterium]